MPIIKKTVPCPRRCHDKKCKRNPRLDLAEKPIVWILGGPGVGKGTQCAKIIEKYGFTHLSTGDLLRAEVKCGSPRAAMLSEIMDRGALVPTEIVLELLIQAIDKHAPHSNGFLIDGYPREEHQGVAFVEAIAPATAIIYLEARKETLEQRLLGRAMTSDRVDDNEETIKARIQTFLENNDKVIGRYPERLNRINAEQDVDTIFEEVSRVLEHLIPELQNVKPRHSVKAIRSIKSLKSFVRLRSMRSLHHWERE